MSRARDLKGYDPTFEFSDVARKKLVVQMP